MLIVELNEFSSDLLQQAADQQQLTNIGRLLRMQHSVTTAAEQEERFGLDPWVQWVSVHTGKKAAEHGVYHLADADKITDPQIWELLAENKGISYGIWGCMNAKYTPHSQCQFFFPDPWTFTEPAFPRHLNYFLALPRYYAKNYLDVHWPILIKEFIKLAGFLSINIKDLLPACSMLLKTLPKAGLSDAGLFAYFDLINVCLFAKYRKQTSASFCVIFLNTLAHYQHHHWPSNSHFTHFDNAIFSLIDKMLEVIFLSRRREEAIIITNAFSQKNTSSLKEKLYRQKDPATFFSAIGISGFHLEQLMTNDSQLIFASETERDAAARLLRSITVEGKAAFQVDIRKDSVNTLFCQFLIWDVISNDALINLDKSEESLSFYKYFEIVTERTGSHIQQGDIFYDLIELPQKLMNYELSEHISKYYKVLKND